MYIVFTEGINRKHAIDEKFLFLEIAELTEDIPGVSFHRVWPAIEDDTYNHTTEIDISDNTVH